MSTPLFFVEHEELACKLWVKDESKNRTGTFKDRLADALSLQLQSNIAGKDLLISCITLGNTVLSIGQSIISHLDPDQRPQILGLFPEGFSRRGIGPDTHGSKISGADILRSCEALGVSCVEFDLMSGYLSESDIAEIARNNGMFFSAHRDVSYGIGEKAYAPILREALDAMPEPPDRIFVPVGAGVLFEECVEVIEEKGLNTIVTGVSVVDPESIADKIYGYYSPYYQALKQNHVAFYKNEEKHPVIIVEDSNIKRSLAKLSEMNIDAEPSAAAAFVPVFCGNGYNKYAAREGETILVINTGNGLQIAHV